MCSQDSKHALITITQGSYALLKVAKAVRYSELQEDEISMIINNTVPKGKMRQTTQVSFQTIKTSFTFIYNAAN